MAEGIGLLTGLLTVVLVGVFIFAFFRKCGMLSKNTASLLKKSGALCLCFGVIFFAFGLLVRRIVYGAEALGAPWEVFSSSGIRNALHETTAGRSLLFLPGHALGLLFSGNFAAGGITLSFLISFLSLFLILRALQRCFSENAALRIGLLLLALPGAFLCFLPGAIPYLFLLSAILFFILFKPKASVSAALPAFVWEGVLALSSILSAMVMYLYAAGSFA